MPLYAHNGEASMSLKKFTGTYISVMDALFYPKNFYQAQDIEAYNRIIKADRNRTVYLSYTSTVAQMQQRLSATEHLEGKTLSYTQGNFDADVFSAIPSTNALKIMQEHIERLSEQQTLLQQKKSAATPEESLALDEQIEALDEQIYAVPIPDSKQLRISYTNDKNELMALCIYYIRDDSNLDIPLAERPLNTGVAIIQNPHFAPDERQVTYFAPETLLDRKAIALGQDIGDDEFGSELEQALGSTHLKQLVTNVFNGTQISLEYFNDLSKRLGSNRNIDYRDDKQNQLEYFFQFIAHNLSTDLVLQADVDEIKLRLANETNFFQKQQFENELKTLHERIAQAIAEFPEPKQTLLKTLNNLNLWASQLQAQALEQEKVGHEKQLTQVAKFNALKGSYQFAADNLSTAPTLAASIAQIQLPAPSESNYQDEQFIHVVNKLYEQIEHAINGVEGPRQPFLRVINQLNLWSAKLKLAATISNDKSSDYLGLLLREAFAAKAQELDQQIATNALAAQNQSFNELIDNIFLTAERQAKQTIEERINIKTQSIPVVEKPAVEPRNFFRRNWPSLSVATTATLLSIGLFLVASGLFITLTGLALIATIVGAASTLALALGTEVNIANDELKRKKQFDSATTSYNKYTSWLNSLIIEKNAQLAALELELPRQKQNVNKAIVEVEVPEEIHVQATDDEGLLSLIDQTLDAGEQHLLNGSEITVELPQEDLSVTHEVEPKSPEDNNNNQPKI